jgi:hypothetical protein
MHIFNRQTLMNFTSLGIMGDSFFSDKNSARQITFSLYLLTVCVDDKCSRKFETLATLASKTKEVVKLRKKTN